MTHQVIAYKTNRLTGDAYATITTQRRRLCIRSTHRAPNKNVDKAYFPKTSDARSTRFIVTLKNFRIDGYFHAHSLPWKNCWNWKILNKNK